MNLRVIISIRMLKLIECINDHPVAPKKRVMKLLKNPIISGSSFFITNSPTWILVIVISPGSPGTTNTTKRRRKGGGAPCTRRHKEQRSQRRGIPCFAAQGMAQWTIMSATTQSGRRVLITRSTGSSIAFRKPGTVSGESVTTSFALLVPSISMGMVWTLDDDVVLRNGSGLET